MNELLEKLSSYNIFNYLLPGIIFSYSTELLANIQLTQNQIVISAFLYYFYGLVISRIGAILVEPFLNILNPTKKHSYDLFLKASTKDPKIEILLEARNMYRTFCSLFLMLGLIYFFRSENIVVSSIANQYIPILITFLFCIFLISFYRQNQLLVDRVSIANQP